LIFFFFFLRQLSSYAESLHDFQQEQNPQNDIKKKPEKQSEKERNQQNLLVNSFKKT
jgi:hypothetical protein